MPAPQLVNSSQGSVPSQTSGSTVNPAEILSSILSQSQSEMQKYALKAATPIPGGSQGSFPLSMDPTPRQTSPGQLDHREVVGSGNAKAQGIGNSVIGVMNAVAGAKTAVDNKKRLEVATATQQLLTAQSALNQAKQILQNDPNNVQAQEIVKHNTDIMNGILSQDKLRNAIGKGFHIDFTDPSANQTPEHQAVADGRKMAEKTLSYADQFNKKTPEVMVPNQQAIAQYQAAASAQKMQMETMKAMVPLLTASMRAETAEHQIQGRMDQEKFRQAQESARALMTESGKWDRLTGQIMAQKSLANDKFHYAMAEIGQRAALEMKNFRQKAAMAKNDPIALQKAYQVYEEKSTSESVNIAKNIAELEGQKDTLIHNKAEQSQIDSVTQQIQSAKEQQQQFKITKDANTNWYHQILKFGGYDGDNPNSGSDAARKSETDITSASFWAGGESTDSVGENEDSDEEQP